MVMIQLVPQDLINLFRHPLDLGVGIVTQLTIGNLLNQHFPGREGRTLLHDLVPVINFT